MTTFPGLSASQHQSVITWGRKRVSAPLLLVGSARAREACAFAIAQWLFCEIKGDVACGTCRSCQQVKRQTHPDVIIGKTDTATWTIKAMRQFTAAMSNTPATSQRLIVLHDLEKASLPAANALLKSLEEPRPSSRFLATTSWPQRLLPTIRSRSYRLQLHEATVASVATIPIGELLEKPVLSPEDVAQITQWLTQELNQQGPTPALRRAYFRLRDYYVISSQHGNSKLAQEVLLLSLPVKHGMS